MRVHLLLVALLLSCAMSSSAELVSFRSGVADTTPGRDGIVSFLPGPTNGAFADPFDGNDFLAARTGPMAYIIAPHAVWLDAIAFDTLACWIGDTPSSSNSGSALYAVHFNIEQSFETAALHLHYLVDNTVGERADFPSGQDRPGLYLNETAIDSTSGIGEYQFAEENVVVRDITDLLVVGENVLYIYNYDASNAAGVLFSAVVATDDEWTTDLAVACDVYPADVALGDTLMYTLTVANNGPRPEPSATLENRLPDGCSYVSGSSTQGVFHEASGRILWEVGAVPLDGTATLTLTAVLDAARVANTAEVHSTIYYDPLPDNNESTALASIQCPSTYVPDDELGVGAVVSMSRPFPNPASGAASFHLNLGAPRRVRLSVYDVAGRLVATPVDSMYDLGAHLLVWNGSDSEQRPVPSGVYFARLSVRDRDIHEKFIVIR